MVHLIFSMISNIDIPYEPNYIDKRVAEHIATTNILSSEQNVPKHLNIHTYLGIYNVTTSF